MTLVGCASQAPPSSSSQAASPTQSPVSPESLTATPTSTASATPTPISRNPVNTPSPWAGVPTALPGSGSFLAWTVDDGADAQVIRQYGLFAQRTGIRLTFFVNGKFAAHFEQNLDVLGPLVESGQLQIANHTYSHTALTSLSVQGVQDELMSNDQWIRAAFGVQPAPYFRAPYGYYDQRVLDAAAGVGYSRAVQWYGSFADSSNIPAGQILDLAQQYVKAQAIVIGHLNYPGIIEVFDDVAALIEQRGLQTVTLADYFMPPA